MRCPTYTAHRIKPPLKGTSQVLTFYRLGRIPTIARAVGRIIHPGTLAGADLVEPGVELEEPDGIARCHGPVRACVDHGVASDTRRGVGVI